MGHAERLISTHDVLSMFDHPNIVKPIERVGDEHEPCLVLEDIQGIDLKEYSARFEKGQFPLAIFLNIATQLAEALSVIHHAHVHT